jgi:hypothetical protein
MNLILLIGLAATLGGCGSLAGAQRDCNAHPGYLAMWNCIKGEAAANRTGHMRNAAAVRYMTVGDALAERVRSGTLTDTQAKLMLAEELSRGEKEFEAWRRSRMPPAAPAIVTVPTHRPPTNCVATTMGSQTVMNCN